MLILFCVIILMMLLLFVAMFVVVMLELSVVSFWCVESMLLCVMVCVPRGMWSFDVVFVVLIGKDFI